MIPYGKQDINEDDIRNVVEVLQSDFITQGPKVSEFELAVSGYCGAEYGVAVNSATSALHIACLALGLNKGDWLWTVPNTFVASANCAIYCGAYIDFVDIDPDTYNMSPRALAVKLEIAKEKGILPKIVIPVHFAGQSCEMKKIHELSQKYGFSIIEDASHAVGGSYLNSKVGSCLYSDISVFSFHPVKIITTAEGGIATTNSNELANKMKLLRSHGVTRDIRHMTKSYESGWYYEQIDLGFNYRMTEMQAALGVSQMKRLDSFVQKRNELAEKYFLMLDDLPVKLPSVLEGIYSAYHLFSIQIESIKTRKQVYDEMIENGVGVNVHYIPVHTQPFYQKLGFKEGDYPISENYYKNALSIPLFSKMTHAEQKYVSEALKRVLS